MMDKKKSLERLHTVDRELKHLSHVSSLLQWDQETYLPSVGIEERTDQLALIEALKHGRLCEPELGELLAQLGSTPKLPEGDTDLDSLERNFLRVFRKSYDRAIRLPEAFVREVAKAEGLSQAAWVEARAKNNFSFFLPHLRKMVDFSRRKAEFWGFADHSYDGLLDLYEPGMTEERITAVFTPLGEKLSQLVKVISSRPQADYSFLKKNFPIEQQDSFSRHLLDVLGMDRARSRLDRTVHPFTTTLGTHDVRITTRFFADNVLSGIFSTIHEAGHGMYELGYGHEITGTCLADGASMGIHESQSRLWENVIGRGKAFWQGRLPKLHSLFPEQLSGVTLEDFYHAINWVEPSLIRVDADEITYSLHIILRYNLERRLIDGSLDVADLPEAWNEEMVKLLGIRSPTDTDGVLQDIHWSMGAFGYFPSYALGNLYALHFWETLTGEEPAIDALIESGDFTVIQRWLKEHIHTLGCSLAPAELLLKVCGEPLSIQPFLRYLDRKYTTLYGT